MNVQDTLAPTSWRERRKQQLRDALIDCATDLFEERGLAGVSVEDITARTGVAKGTFYLYFASKAEIVEAALEAGLQKLEQVVTESVRRKQSAPDSLRSCISALLAFLEQHHSVISYLSFGWVTNGAVSQESRDRLRDRYRHITTSVYEDVIGRAMSDSFYRKVDPRATAYALFGMVTGLIQQAIADGKGFTGIENTAIELLERGIKGNE